MRAHLVVAGLLVALVAGAAKPRSSVRVLTKLRPQQVYASMLLVAASLGVSCDHCHDMNDFASDARPEKETARQMMRMVAGLNREPKVNGRVTCFTCHRGRTEPVSTPPLPDEPVAAAGTAPSLNELLARPRGSATTLIARGKVSFERQGKPSPPVPVELTWKAPAKLRLTEGEGDQAMTIIVDGDRGWRVMRGGAHPLGELDLANSRRDAAWGPGLDPAAAYASLSVAGTATLDGKPVVRVEATPKDRQHGPVTIESEELAFDAASGLVVRRGMVVRTALGLLPVATELGDHRAVGGVKVPFRVRRVGPGFAETMVFDEVLVDRPVPDELFVAPK